MEFFKLFVTEIFTLFFLIITFFQSGIDKVVDWNGNLLFLKDHFKSTPFKNIVALLLVVILVLELLAAAIMTVGIFSLLVIGSKELAFIGVQLSALTLILLLIGQRIAKDYAGAMTLAVYFIIAIFSMYMLK